MTSPSLSRVVVVCASAGGLQPLRALLDVLHVDASTAVLVAMHQPAGASSELVGLLEMVVRVPVRWVTDGMRVESGCVQVVPTGTSMVFDGSAFRARSPPHRSHTPFDDLLRQVARWFGDHSAAVVLSGAGSDSADGSAAVVGAGGHVYAQLPSSADFSSMPEAVIIRGLPSLVATPQAIAEHLNGKRLDVDGVETGTVTVDAAVRMLVAGGGPDFRLYKPGLIARRMDHRARSLGHRSVQSYVDALATDAAELDALRQDLMISVTSSFRDPGMWDTLAHTVIAPMLTVSEAHGGPRRAVRAWVAACATGEEAYSIAMLLAEAHLRLGLPQDFQVIATDVDERSVAHARTGALSDNALLGIPEGLRTNWLEQVAGGFQISAKLRERVLFGRHDVLADPPFGNIDILCCRNLFIYLNARGQRLALTNFRRAMSDGAYLVLGRDESLPDVALSWQVVSARHRIYRTPERTKKFENLEGAEVMDAQTMPATARQHASPAALLDTVTPLEPSHATALSDLRTAYESLQCVNEELQTLNDELRSVNVLLEQAVARERDAATKLHALIASSSQPLLVVDTAGCVEHFSKSAMSLFRLRAGDEGRALGDFANDLRWPELDATLRRSAADGGVLSLEVADIRGGHWLATVTAIGSALASERKVLLSLADVSRLRDAVHLQAVLDAMPQQVAVLDAQGQIEQVNRAWRTFGLDNGADPAKTDVGVNYLQSSQPAELECDPYALQAAQGVKQVLSGSMARFRMRYPCPTPKREAWFVLDVVPLSRPGGGCVVSHTEVTDLLRPPGVN